jgi:serine/threonine protein kinase
MPANILKEGPGCKLGRIIRNWKNRWFVLQDTAVHYYARQGGKLKGSIPLNVATNVDRATPSECHKQPAFKVELGAKRTYFVHVPLSDIDDWIKHLKQVTGNGGAAPLGSEPAAAKKVSVDDFELLRVIGRRSFGEVQLVRCREDGQLYAMKSLRKESLREAGQLEQAVVERNVLKQTSHPFLVCAHYAFQTSDKIFLILDYVPGGALFARLRDEQRFTESRARLYAAEILLGLGHLHKQGIIYRDLKPDNILVDQHGHLRITDFGMAKTDMEGDMTTATFCGAPDYIAPEMLQGRQYTKAVDWWSYGILLFEMLAGLPPFFDENSNKMYHMAIKDPVRFPDYFSAPAQDLITKLLEKDPAKRLGTGEADFVEIKAHPFFEPIDFDRLMKREIEPEWKPTLNGELDVSHFDRQFTGEQPGVSLTQETAIDQQSLQVPNFTFQPARRG